MKRNKTFLPNLGTTMVVAIAALIVAQVLVPDVWAASRYRTLYRFKGGTDGNTPEAGLIFDRAGNLYGTTQLGGANNCDGAGCGTIFRLSPNRNGTWTENVLHSFSFQGAWDPQYAGLIFDASENLYGATPKGGSYGGGTVFELTNGTWNETILHSFSSSGNDGYGPSGRPIFDHAGNLYGTTYQGGIYSGGTVFQLTPNRDGSWTENILYSFHQYGNDGWYPVAGLILDAAGNLYGTTQFAGTSGTGTVFQLSPNGDGSWTESVLHTFNGQDGSQPWAGLIFDSAGNLYGTTQLGGAYGYGTVFRLSLNVDGSWQESVLHSFQRSTKDGCVPYGLLIFDKAGNLFGATAGCGAYGYGTVFELKASATDWEEAVLHSFRDLPGAYPVSALVFDARGRLYGTTSGDNKTTFGSVFAITP